MSRDVFSEPPDEELWRDELLSRAFVELPRRLRDPDVFRAAVHARIGAAHVARFRDAKLKNASDDLVVLQHFHLLSAFVDGKMSSAITDVVRTHLPAYDLDKRKTPNRLMLLCLLYEKDPRTLCEVHVLDRWHGARRTVLKLEGKHPYFTEVPHQLWLDRSSTVLRGLRANDARRWGDVELKVVARRKANDLLLGFRRAGRGRVGRSETGRGVETFDDDWLIVRLWSGGWFADLTTRDVDGALRLATGLAGVSLSDPSARYRFVVDSVTPQQVGQFVAQLISGGDEHFPLAEIVWKDRDGNTCALTNVGATRIEGAVAKYVTAKLFAPRPSAVRSAKIIFGGHYRMQLHFPDPGVVPVISYSDLDRPKDVTADLEAHVLRHAGVLVHPRAGRRALAQGGLPTLFEPDSVEELERLLAPVVDELSDAEMERLHVLAASGLVEAKFLDWFYCAEASGLGSVDSISCDGEVEIDDAGDGDDIGRTESDGAVECHRCQRNWQPRLLKVKVRRRARVTVKPNAVWKNILERLAPIGFRAHGPRGVAVRDGHQRDFVVFAPLASAAWRVEVGSASQRVCAIASPDDALSGRSVVSLAAALSSPDTSVEAALAAPTTGRTRPDGVEEGANAWPAPAPAARGRIVVALRDGQMFVGDAALGRRAPSASDYLRGLCLIAAAARVATVQPGLATDEEVVRRLGPRMSPSSIGPWGSRARKALMKQLGQAMFDRVVERGPNDVGARIVAEVKLEGFE